METQVNREVDKELLLDIFRIGSMSQVEYDMAEYVCNFLEANNIPFQRDKFNNIWNIDNIGRPLLSAHLDTVQDTDDYLLAGFAKIKGDILRSYGVLGGDDKAGIYAILHVLLNRPDVNFVFFVEEEIGGTNGSTYWSRMNGEELEKNALWSIVIDRRGNSDILCYDHFGTYGTKEFQYELLSIGAKYGLTSAQGSVSDADKLKYYTSSANISAGYYNPHSKSEYVFIPDLQKTIDFLIDCVDNITEAFAPPEDDGFMGYDAGFLREDEYNFLLDDYTGFDDEYSFNNAKSGDIIKEKGQVKYYIESLNAFYTGKELDDIIMEIIDVQQENGRVF